MNNLNYVQESLNKLLLQALRQRSYEPILENVEY